MVRGRIVTTADEPVPLAEVVLRTRSDSAAIRRTESGDLGQFQFAGVAPGLYHLFIRRIGYRAVLTVEFTVEGSATRDLGRIRLDAMAVELEPMVVTVERPDVAVEPDRIGYLVEALAGTPDAVVTDALRNIPDVEIEFDGTVRVRGATPTIFINGQPAPISGQSLAAFLEQFPANQIERIEVLETPPARYSAEGAGGIINIVLKEGTSLGVNGSASLSAGTRGQRSAGSRITLQRGPWTVNGGANLRWSDTDNANFTLRQNLLATPTTFLQQDARSTTTNRGGGGSMDIRRTLSPRSRLWARVGGQFTRNSRHGETETIHLDADRQAELWYDRRSRNQTRGGSGSAMLGYAYSWQPQRHTLEVQLDGQLEDSRGAVRDETEADPIFHDGELLPPWLINRESTDRTTGYRVELNYTRPWGGQGRLEAGTSYRNAETRQNQETSRFEQPEAPTPDHLDVRLVARRQQTASAYFTAHQRLGRFGLMAGVRGEMVASDVTLPSGDPLERDEWNLFPNLNLSWNPRPRLNLRVGYSRRINRPGISYLDPTDRSTDPLNRTVGNPDLKSSLTHNLSANLSWTGRLGQFTASPYWRRTTDGWERITTVDADGVSTTTWANLTSRTDMGMSASWGPPRVAGWRPRLNLSAGRSVLSGGIRSGTAGNGALRWSVGGNVDGTILGTLTAQGSFGYSPPRDLVQGRTSGQWRADLSFRYRMLDNRTSVNLSVQDPFGLRRTTQELRDPSVIQTGTNRITTRSVNLSASYSFGRLGRGRS